MQILKHTDMILRFFNHTWKFCGRGSPRPRYYGILNFVVGQVVSGILKVHGAFIFTVSGSPRCIWRCPNM